MLYINRKKSVTNPEGIGGKSNKIVGGKSCHQQTREEVAKETGVSPRTIASDAAYAEADQLTQSVLCHDPHRRTQLR
jgi:hypothetical protein